MMLKEKKDFHVVLVALYGVENAGIRYLSAFMKRAGFRISVIYFKEYRNNYNLPPSPAETGILLELLSELNPDLLGISVMSSLLSIAGKVTGEIKKKFSFPVLWGGIHPTTAPEECLEFADYACVGEGEGPLWDLAESLRTGGDGSSIDNIWMKRDGEILKADCRPLIQDLDSLPHPDMLDEGKYFIDEGRLSRGDPALKGAEYRIYTSRGCPFACSYCYNSIMRRIYRGKGRYYRHRSPEHVMEELEMAKANFPGLRRIKVDDDTAFAFGKDWLDRFCRLYVEKIGIPFECLIHPHLLREDYLWKLKSAGLVKVQIGIESASEDEVEGIFKRKSGNRQIRDFAELNRKLRIEAVYDVIIDNPMATEKDRRALFDFLMELPGPYKIYLYSLVFFPGTELTRDLLEKGIITPDQVEGKSDKALRQFRVTFNYPRPPEEVFWLSLILLVSKEFVPRSFTRWLSGIDYFRKNPGPLFAFAQFCNFIKMGQVGLEMLFRGELTMFKLKQYGSISRMISQ